MQQQNVYMMSQTAIRLAEGSGGAKAVFYLSNHRGDTLAAHRGDSTLVAKYRYDAFGNQRTAYCKVNDSQNAPRYTFSTKEYLSDAGLYLYPYRVYDPVAGRWTQRDPIDYQDSLNLYCFCRNTPFLLTDPDGRSPGLVGFGIGFAVGAVGGFVHGVVCESISSAKGKGFSWKRVGKSTLIAGAGLGMVGGLAGALTGDPSGALIGGLTVKGVFVASAGVGVVTGTMDGLIDTDSKKDADNPPKADKHNEADKQTKEESADKSSIKKDK